MLGFLKTLFNNSKGLLDEWNFNHITLKNYKHVKLKSKT